MYPICIPARLHQLWRHVKGTCGARWSEELVLLSPVTLGCNMIQKQIFFFSPQQPQGCSHPAWNREWVACAVKNCEVQSILPYYPFQWDAGLVIRVLSKILTCLVQKTFIASLTHLLALVCAIVILLSIVLDTWKEIIFSVCLTWLFCSYFVYVFVSEAQEKGWSWLWAGYISLSTDIKVFQVTFSLCPAQLF